MHDLGTKYYYLNRERDPHIHTQNNPYIARARRASLVTNIKNLLPSNLLENTTFLPSLFIHQEQHTDRVHGE